MKLHYKVIFKDPIADQYRGTTSPNQSGLGHYQYLNGPIYPLNRNQWAAYVTATIQRILEFLEM
jgi:hypothetical protein